MVFFNTRHEHGIAKYQAGAWYFSIPCPWHMVLHITMPVARDLELMNKYGNNPSLFAWIYDITTKTWRTGFPLSPPIKDHHSFLVPKSFCQ